MNVLKFVQINPKMFIPFQVFLPEQVEVPIPCQSISYINYNLFAQS